MGIKNTILIIIIYGMCTQASAQTLPDGITLATTNWCPYACEQEKDQHGIIYEYITQILKEEGINVDIQFYPWTRSIKLATTGEVDGLLTAVKSEAPNLLFTTTPTDIYQMCFFTKHDQQWRYKDKTSLTQIKFGTIQNYGYGEPIDSYLLSSPKNVYQITAEGVPRLNRMLINNRFDAFIDDEKVVKWQLKHEFNQLRNAGCLAETPFYLAIHPERTWAKPLIELLNRTLKSKHNLLKTIQVKYQ